MRILHVLSEAILGEGGYTLVEMVTVMAIIAVLSGLVVANTQFGDRRQQLRDATANYVTAAKLAESSASTSAVVGGSSRKAYGVCLTSTAQGDNQTNNQCDQPAVGQALDMYQVYARSTADTTYTQPPNRVGVPAPNIIASYTLPKDMRFTSSLGNVWFDFLPPGPSLTLKGAGTSGQLTVQYGSGASGYSRIITINPGAGAVYAQ